MEIILLAGYPASGKSYITNDYVQQGYTILSRDVIGGTYKDVLKEVKKCKTKMVIDGTNLTEDSRASFITYAKDNEIPIKCVFVENTMENCMVNALHRQWLLNGNICMEGNNSHPHMFPSAVLFKARKVLQIPTIKEGFDSVDIINGYIPSYDPKIYYNKAIFFDIDGTLRKTDHLEYKYPTHPNEVIPYTDINNMKNVIEPYIKKGYILVGVSNQSGITKGTVSNEMVKECMDKTKDILELNMEIMWCPHAPVPVSCYCRKPQSGMGVYFIEKYKLNPKKCYMIGDQTTDKTFASRLDIKFIHVTKFFI